MLARSLTMQDGGLIRPFTQGDLDDTAELPAALTTAGAGSVTAALISRGILDRSGPGAGFTDTFDGAQNIVNAVSGNLDDVAAEVTFGDLYVVPGTPQPGATFRFLYINTVAFAMTAAVTANTGIVLGANVNVAASLWREYLFSLLNTTKTSIVQGNTTNASPVVTGLTAAQTRLISPGQTVAGTGITAGTKILSVQHGVGFTMDANATATGSTAITCMPSVTLRGLRSGTA